MPLNWYYSVFFFAFLSLSLSLFKWCTRKKMLLLKQVRIRITNNNQCQENTSLLKPFWLDFWIWSYNSWYHCHCKFDILCNLKSWITSLGIGRFACLIVWLNSKNCIVLKSHKNFFFLLISRLFIIIGWTKMIIIYYVWCQFADSLLMMFDQWLEE